MILCRYRIIDFQSQIPRRSSEAVRRTASIKNIGHAVHRPELFFQGIDRLVLPQRHQLQDKTACLPDGVVLLHQNAQPDRRRHLLRGCKIIGEDSSAISPVCSCVCQRKALLIPCRPITLKSRFPRRRPHPAFQVRSAAASPAALTQSLDICLRICRDSKSAHRYHNESALSARPSPLEHTAHHSARCQQTP